MADKVAEYFDAAAEGWDKKSRPDPAILEKIADVACISADKTVLDAGCGTGVMFPVYFGRNVRSVTAVDVSPNMLREAEKKYPGHGVSFVCSDVADISTEKVFDCVVVHNAFPHFLRQREAMDKLRELTAVGGTLTVAHSISRAAVLQCHRAVPDISLRLPEAQTVAEMFGEDFGSFTVISDDKCFIVSAVKNK